MKICFATDYLPNYHKTNAGAEQACLRLANVLIDNQEELAFLTTKPNLKSAGDYKVYGVTTVENFLGRRFKNLMIRLFPFDPISALLSFNLLRKIKPDILSLHNHTHLSFSLVWSAKKLGIPTVFSVYDHWTTCPKGTLINEKEESCRSFQGEACVRCLPSQKMFFALAERIGLLIPFIKLRKKITDYFLRRIDAFIVLSNTWAEILQEYGVNKEKIFVVPLPLFKKVEVKKTSSEENSILFVGWVKAHKGLHVLIEAFPRVLKEIPNAKIYVVESGVQAEYKARLLNFIKDNKMEKHVFFLGKKSNQEVQELLKRYELVVVPEKWGIAWPVFLTEAMAFAKPIVASGIGDIPSFIVDKESGLIADDRNPSDFSDKIIWILKNKNKAKEMGQRARSNINQICNEDIIYEKLLQVYKKAKGEVK